MKATELRIGNWIIIDGYGETQVTGVNLSEWDELNKQELCEPIALTEEWLVRLGFEKKEATTSFPEHEFIFPSESEKPKEDNGYYFFIGQEICANKQIQYALMLREEIDSENQFGMIVVESVHQLQNLYFALTGDELETKE